MDKDWKELELNPENEWTIDFKRPYSAKIRYKEILPKPPTHEEIMTKWWKFESGNWERITAFNPAEYAKGKHCYRTGEIGWSTKSSFIGRESADIPPEN